MMTAGLTRWLAGLTILAGAATPALAQQQYVGQWQCEFTYTELNNQGQRTSGHVRQYMIAIYPNSTFEAQGQISSPIGYDPFQAQGQWRVDSGTLFANGPELIAGMPTGGPTFVMGGTIGPDGLLRSFYEQADPSNSYPMNRQIYACQRMQ